MKITASLITSLIVSAFIVIQLHYQFQLSNGTFEKLSQEEAQWQVRAKLCEEYPTIQKEYYIADSNYKSTKKQYEYLHKKSKQWQAKGGYGLLIDTPEYLERYTKSKNLVGKTITIKGYATWCQDYTINKEYFGICKTDGLHFSPDIQVYGNARDYAVCDGDYVKITGVLMAKDKIRLTFAQVLKMKQSDTQ